MPRALRLYVPVYDHFLGVAERIAGGGGGRPSAGCHCGSITLLTKREDTGMSSTFIMQPAAGPVEEVGGGAVRIALSSRLLQRRVCVFARVCVSVCADDGVRSPRS